MVLITRSGTIIYAVFKPKTWKEASLTPSFSSFSTINNQILWFLKIIFILSFSLIFFISKSTGLLQASIFGLKKMKQLPNSSLNNHPYPFTLHLKAKLTCVKVKFWLFHSASSPHWKLARTLGTTLKHQVTSKNFCSLWNFNPFGPLPHSALKYMIFIIKSSFSSFLLQAHQPMANYYSIYSTSMTLIITYLIVTSQFLYLVLSFIVVSFN